MSSHYNILMANSIRISHRKHSWHSYNGLMTANVKANHMTV